MAETALECGLLDSEWTGRDSLCQAGLKMEAFVMHVVLVQLG